MPIVHIHLMEGRTTEQKRAVIADVTEAIADSLDAPRDSIRVLIHEMPKENWGIGGISAQDLGR